MGWWGQLNVISALLIFHLIFISRDNSDLVVVPNGDIKLAKIEIVLYVDQHVNHM